MLLCFNVNSRKTLDQLPYWRDGLLKYSPTVPTVLVGCRADVQRKEREISFDEAQVSLAQDETARIGGRGKIWRPVSGDFGE